MFKTFKVTQLFSMKNDAYSVVLDDSWWPMSRIWGGLSQLFTLYYNYLY